MQASAEILDKYELVVGLEVHCQLLTQSKIFSWEEAAFGGAPNTHVSVVNLAHPGTLPKFNQAVAALAVRMGLACQSSISRYNIFDRKSYFYPDLPKGYQLTQDRTPICKGGQVAIKWKDAQGQWQQGHVRLNRIHMEEDAGKLMHLPHAPESLVDLNRAGVPLIEIVTEPDIRHAEEAYAYLAELRRLVRYLDICDGNMEEGSMRCDANVSVRLKGQTQLGRKVEIKNMNSLRNVQRAIEHEFARQVAIVESGGQIISETRLFNADNGTTFSMRTKEEMNDYRYFPDPDLAPFTVSDEWLEDIAQQMPPLPWQLLERLMQHYDLPEYDAKVLTEEKALALYFEEACTHTPHYKALSNWLMGPVKSYLNEHGLDIQQFALSPGRMAELVELCESGKVSFAIAAKQLLPAMAAQPQNTALATAQALDLLQNDSQEAIGQAIAEVLQRFPNEVQAYKKGKKNLLGMFMGEVMKAAKGKLDPRKANELVKAALEA